MTRRKKNINKLIPCGCGVCGLTLWQYDKWGKKRTQIKGHSFFGKKHTVETIRKQSEVKKGKIHHKIRGEKHPFWKGDNIGYKGLHQRIRKQKPKPEFCEICSLVPPRELSNISGKYLLDKSDYRDLCAKCHRQYDHRFKFNKKLLKRFGNELILCLCVNCNTEYATKLKYIKFSRFCSFKCKYIYHNTS